MWNKNLLISGRPGSGKTTLIMKVIDHIGRGVAGGFYTEEIREGKQRIGFIAKTLDGREHVLAHVDVKSGFRVSRYHIDVSVIDRLIVESIEDAVRNKEIVIMDEIGKMEMFSKRFKESVLHALDSPKVVIATIPVYNNRFLDGLKKRDDVKVLELTIESRERLFKDVMSVVRP
jgi:nucleoside-triphosphatase